MDQRLPWQVDVLIATAKQRLDNMLFQIFAALSSGLRVRVTVAMDGDWPELESRIPDEMKKNIRFVKDAPKGFMGGKAVQHCMETLDWADWFYNTGDDDAILPWGLKHLYEARDGVEMVIGQILCVSREDHIDLSAYKVGATLEKGKVSGNCVLINFRAIEKLSKPWFNADSSIADWELIKRISNRNQYKFIPNVVNVLSLVDIKKIVPDYHMKYNWKSEFLVA